MKSLLILLRHGESILNAKNVFTGWIDVPLSKKGIDQALAAGEMIKDILIDEVYTSNLIRAQTTAFLAMVAQKSGRFCNRHQFLERQHSDWATIYEPGLKTEEVPIYTAWELNERMYGKLQGKNKKEAAMQFGEDQVHRWRRSFNEAPPGGESLEQTAKRTIPYFEKHILPSLTGGNTILVCAHGNSLRSIVMDIEKLTPEEICRFEMPLGEPRIYEFSAGHFHLKSKQ